MSTRIIDPTIAIPTTTYGNCFWILSKKLHKYAKLIGFFFHQFVILNLTFVEKDK